MGNLGYFKRLIGSTKLAYYHINIKFKRTGANGYDERKHSLQNGQTHYTYKKQKESISHIYYHIAIINYQGH